MTADHDGQKKRASDACLSDLLLDRLVAGEQGRDLATALTHADSCPACSQRLSARKEAWQAFPDELDLPSLSVATLDRLEASAEGRRMPLWQRLTLVLTPAVAAVLVVVFLWVLPADREGEGPGTTRIKGRPSFSLVIKRGERQIPGESGGVFRAGDQLRFRTTAGEAFAFGLFDVEPGGQVTRFVPVAGEVPIRIRPGNKMLLDASVELDASVGTEQLVGVFCPGNFSLANIEAALAAWEQRSSSADALGRVLPPGCTTQQFTMNKVGGDG